MSSNISSNRKTPFGQTLSVALLLAALILALSMAVFAADGDLDTSFDTDGLVTTSVTSDARGRGVAVQTDGKIVVAGHTTATFALTRYTTSGALDTNFGGGGTVTTNFGNTDKAYGIVIQPDGKIIAAGTSGTDFALARYETSGLLDTSFGANGLVTTDFNAFPGFTTAGGYAVALDSNGKIIVVGYVQHGSEYEDFAVARYNNDGTLDTTFNPNGSLPPGAPGIVTTPVRSQEPDRAYGVAIQSDNKIVVVGETKGSPGIFALLRYNTDGSLDTTLSGDGKVEAATTKVSAGRGVAIQPNGMIVATAAISVIDLTSQNCIDSAGKYCEFSDFWMGRFTSTGAPDNNFGTAGEVATPINTRGNDDNGEAITIQPDGRIVVAGTTDSGIYTFSGDDKFGNRRPDFALVRYTSNGAPDASFGTDGKVITDFTPGQQNEGHQGHAVALQADGKIVVAGESQRKFAVARYDAGPTPTTTAIINHVPDPSEVGQQVSLLIWVSAANNISPTGNVTITDGTESCSGALIPGISGTGPSALDCTLTFATPGTKTLTATYAGDASFSGSSTSVTHTVTAAAKQNTTTTITSNTPNPSTVGLPVIVTYSVTAASGTPTGTVTVSDGTVACNGTVATGTCTMVPTTAGNKTLTATYNGDAAFNASSGTASHTVTGGTTPTKEFLYLSIVVQAQSSLPGTGWTTGMQFQNVGTADSDIQFLTYNATGTEFNCGAKTAEPGGSVNYLMDNACPTPPTFDGSGVTLSDEPARGIVHVNNASVGQAGGIYTASTIDEIATTLFFPLVKHNHFGRTTMLAIQNAGSGPVDFTATFQVLGKPYVRTYTNVPSRAKVVVTPADAGVPAGNSNVGSLTIVATGPMAGASLEHQHSTTVAENLQAAQAFSPADYDNEVYCPLFRNAHTAAKLTTGAQVQNVSSATQTVTLTYAPRDGGPTITSSQSVEAGASATFYAPFIGIPAGSVGSVTITSTGYIVAVVNDEGRDNGRQRATTYACFPAKDVSTRVVLPLYKEFWLGNTSGIQIQNVGNANASIEITYIATNKAANVTFTPGSLVPAGGSTTFFGVSQGIFPPTMVAISGNQATLGTTYGSVVIESDVPIVAIANESGFGPNASPQDSKNYEGFNQ